MMRLLAFLAVVVPLVWGTTELIARFIYPDFEIHTELILGAIGLGFGAKWAQKTTEKKKEDATD